VVQDLLFKYEVLSSNPNLPEKKLQKMKQKWHKTVSKY
jgi:hypothetical protein